jgi:hypothetical protein
MAATPLTVMASSLATTGVSSISYVLLGVPKDLLGWGLTTLGALVYNAILVVSIFWLFSRRRGRA